MMLAVPHYLNCSKLPVPSTWTALSSLRLTPSTSPSLFQYSSLPLSLKPAKMANSINNTKSSLNSAGITTGSGNRKLPVLLFDIMDTIVRDPFYHHIPAFFGMSFEELIESKHPTAWIEFEKGWIDETELVKIFFKDGRHFDLQGLKNCMWENYQYIEGMEDLLRALKQNYYEMHAFTNYPIWYNLIEDKLKLSSYLSWTFCSCIQGKRKPDADFYTEVVGHLEVDPGSCIFIDDRKRNVEAAREVGMNGVQFKNASALREDLSALGIHI